MNSRKILLKLPFLRNTPYSTVMYRILNILLILPGVLMAQYSPREIDSLMTTEYYRLRGERKFEEIVTLSKRVIKDAKTIQYPKGEIYGYTRLGNMQYNLRNYQEALASLNYANQMVEQNKIEDYIIKTSIHLGIALCYSESGSTYQNAEAQYQKALFFAQKITNPYEKNFYLYLVYSNLYGLYSNLNNAEKEVFYLRKALSVEKSSYMLTELARYHNVYSKNSDSAKIYLIKSEQIAKTDFDKAALYNQWGKYYEINGQYLKAIEYYKKNKYLARKTKEAPLEEDALIGLYNCHEKLGNLKEAVYYSEKRNHFKDSLRQLQIKNSDVAINDIITKKEKTITEKLSKTQQIFLALGILAILFFLILGIRIYQNKKERKKVQHIIREQEIELKEKEDITLHLQQKVNESFDELIKLAKSNSPEFFTRFKEVYPEKISRLLEIDPKLRVSELTLCAYILLGFKTKDIALYTYKSVNTIRNRKYNLRKKLSIAEEQDMEIWFKNL